MRNRTTLLSARTPNVARARKPPPPPHPLKKRNVRKLVTFKIKRLDVVKPLLLQKCNTQVTRMNASRRLKHKIDSQALKARCWNIRQQHGGWPTWLHKIFFAKAFYKNTDIIILPK